MQTYFGRPTITLRADGIEGIAGTWEGPPECELTGELLRNLDSKYCSWHGDTVMLFMFHIRITSYDPSRDLYQGRKL